MRQHHRPVDASVEASRPRDFTVRLARVRLSRQSVHRISSNVRDDGQRPSFGQDARSRRRDLPDGLSEIFLQSRLDSPNQIEAPQQIGVLAHAIFRPFEVIKRGVALENGHLIARRKNFTFLQD